MPKLHRVKSQNFFRTSVKFSERLSTKRYAKYQRGRASAENLQLPLHHRDSSYLFPVVKLLNKLNYSFEIMPGSQTQENFYIQDKFMNVFFDRYPEYLCCYILCEAPQIDYTVVLFISLDTNGHCEIVSVGLIKSECIAGFSWFIEMFKKHNKSWVEIKFISCVHNYELREVLVRAFPDRPLFLSFFDSLKYFKQDLFGLVPMLSQTDVSKALQIFEQMFFISSESGFADLSKELKQLSPIFFNLFKKNWLSKKDLWAIGLQFDSKLFLKSFNRFLLKIRKLKCSLYYVGVLTHLIEKLHLILFKQRQEFFQQFTNMFSPPILPQYPKVLVIKKYSNILTPYATQLIIEQLTKAESLRNVQKVDQTTYQINENPMFVSFTKCSCIFFTLLRLPCCHIFAVRNYLSLPLFVESFVTSWISTKYQSSFFDLHCVFNLDESNKQSSEQINKLNQIVKLSQEFWNLSLHCCDEVSQKRLDLFRNVVKAWKSNFKINIQISPRQVYSSSDNMVGFENLPADYFKEMYGISLNDILDSENEFSSLCFSSENESV